MGTLKQISAEEALEPLARATEQNAKPVSVVKYVVRDDVIQGFDQHEIQHLGGLSTKAPAEILSDRLELQFAFCQVYCRPMHGFWETEICAATAAFDLPANWMEGLGELLTLFSWVQVHTYENGRVQAMGDIRDALVWDAFWGLYERGELNPAVQAMMAHITPAPLSAQQVFYGFTPDNGDMETPPGEDAFFRLLAEWARLSGGAYMFYLTGWTLRQIEESGFFCQLARQFPHLCFGSGGEDSETVDMAIVGWK